MFDITGLRHNTSKLQYNESTAIFDDMDYFSRVHLLIIMARKALLPLSVQPGICGSPDPTKSYIFLQFCLLHNGPQLQHGGHHLCQHSCCPVSSPWFPPPPTPPSGVPASSPWVICFTIIFTTSTLHTSVWFIPFFMGPSDWIALTILSKELNFHRIRPENICPHVVRILYMLFSKLKE